MPHTPCLAKCLFEPSSAGGRRWCILSPFLFSVSCVIRTACCKVSNALLHILHICLVTAVYFFLHFPERLCPILIPTFLSMERYIFGVLYSPPEVSGCLSAKLELGQDVCTALVVLPPPKHCCYYCFPRHPPHVQASYV